MKCPRCQHENPPQSKFCFECGARLAPACAHCGAELPVGVKFCNQCGQPAGDVTPAPLRFASPDSYTPKHLVDRILTSKSALEGERKQVTVLFADMKSSMELLADRDPEEARALLDPVLELMMEAVHRYEGTVNQVMGDGIMALFGAPLALEEHAVRACYAALRMQESVRRYSDGIRPTDGSLIQIRVGLNSGEVIVRSIGSDLRMAYTAVGQTTHLAARIEQLATPGTIRATAHTARLAEGYAEVKPLGPLPVKGLSEPVEVYEVTGVGPGRSRLHASIARGLTRFFGRDVEFEDIRRALDRAQAGHGQVVGVVGEPGVGKSRFVWEAVHGRDTEGWRIVQTGSASYARATPYLPVVELLERYFGIEQGADVELRRQRVVNTLKSLDDALGPSLSPLLSLLDVPVNDTSWDRLDPPQRRRRTLESITRLLIRESRVQPLLVVVEDLQWIDGETQAVLEGLVESLPAARLMLFVTYRPEYRHGWTNKTYYRQIRIDPLPPESAKDLLDALLGGDDELRSLKRLLVERTEGNPFFLEESVRTLIETDALAGRPGQYRLGKDADTIRLAPTVQVVLAARIDRLPPEQKALLQAAAVIGRDVPFALLREIAGDAEGVVRSHAAALQAAEFIYETSVWPQLEYRFKHALTHEVAYGSLLHDRRRALHGRILETLEASSSGNAGEHIEALAHHAFHGQMWTKAISYLVESGMRWYARSANREAATRFEQALQTLDHLPRTPEALMAGLDARFALRNALWPLGRLEQISSRLREAEELARELGDQRRLGWVYAYMSNHLLTTSEWKQAVVLAELAAAVADEVRDFRLQVAANVYLGSAAFAANDYSKSEHFLRKVVASLPPELREERCELDVYPAVGARAWLGQALAELGAFREGAALGLEAVRLAQELKHPYSVLSACWRLGYLHCVQGEFRDAIELLRRGLSIIEEWNLTLWSEVIKGFLGYAYTCSGRATDGIRLMEPVLGEFTGGQAFRSVLMIRLGEAYLLQHRVDHARDVAHRGVTLAGTSGQRGFEAWGRRLLAQVELASDPPAPDRAETYGRQALDSAAELGMRPLIAHCNVVLGEIELMHGRSARADEHFVTAERMFRELGMRSTRGGRP